MAINVAVIGCGYWGPNLIRNFYENPEVEVSYVCDLMPEKLAKLARRYPTIKLTNSYDEVLKDSKVNAVVIVTPVFTHFKLAKEALLAGKHVLVEKPMCSTSAECHELVALAEEKGLTLMVDHTFVYHGAVRKIKSEIDKGDFGDVVYFDSTRINLGLHQNDVNVVWDLAPHDLATMDYLINSNPVSVHATGASHIGNGIEDIAYLSLTLENGVIAHLNVSWLSPVKIRRILIGGTRKMVVYDDLDPAEKIKIYDKGIKSEEPQTSEGRHERLIQYRIGDMRAPVFDMTEALKAEVEHFVDCIKNKTTPVTDGRAGLRVVKILEAANLSLKTGQPQSLEVAAGKSK
ncbi:MAG: Gfo/Idh/MocA family oxidoreductase [Candidatus Melainabacteria bacterium]|nr:MAG: Gfo/Idh/MocA family oxidoreductase [Candidatus Melainabacteria bacterium]